MKKLFYIVLVVAILLAVGYFVKNEAPVAENTPEVPVAEETVDAEAIGNMEIETEDAETLNDGEIVDGEAAEEVEEVNPDETADEDETVIEE